MQKEYVLREGRTPVWVNSIVRRKMGAAFAAVITNISNRGCRIRTGEPLAAGEVIVLDLPRLGTLSAEVRWSKLGSVGLCFIMGTEAWRPCPSDAQREALEHHGCGTVL